MKAGVTGADACFVFGEEKMNRDEIHLIRLPLAETDKKGEFKTLLYSFIPEGKYSARIRNIRIAQQAHHRYILVIILVVCQGAVLKKSVLICHRGQQPWRLLTVKDDTGIADIKLFGGYATMTNVIQEGDYIMIYGMNVDAISHDAVLPLQLSASPGQDLSFQLCFVPYQRPILTSEPTYVNLTNTKFYTGKTVNIIGLVIAVCEVNDDLDGDHHSTIERDKCFIMTLLDEPISTESNTSPGSFVVTCRGRICNIPCVGNVVTIYGVKVFLKDSFIMGELSNLSYLSCFSSKSVGVIAILTASVYLKMTVTDWTRVDELFILRDTLSNKSYKTIVSLSKDVEEQGDLNELQDQIPLNSSIIHQKKEEFEPGKNATSMPNLMKNNLSFKCQTLKEVDRDMYFNIHCQVIAWSRCTPHLGVLWISDGTNLNGIVDDGGINLNKLRVVKDDVLWQKFLALSVIIHVYDNHVSKIEETMIGKFVTLINVRATVKRDTTWNLSRWKLQLHGGGEHYNRGIFLCDATNTVMKPLLLRLEQHEDKPTREVTSGTFVSNDFGTLIDGNVGSIEKDFKKLVNNAKNLVDCCDVHDSSSIVPVASCEELVKIVDQNLNENLANTNNGCAESYQQNVAAAAVLEQDKNLQLDVPAIKSSVSWQSLEIISEPIHALPQKLKLSSVKKICSSVGNAAFRVKAAILNIKPDYKRVVDIVQWSCSVCKVLFRNSQVSQMVSCGVNRYYCSCSSRGGVLAPLFVFQLLLCDQFMHNLEVIVEGEAAVTFLHGITPTQFLVDAGAFGTISDSLKKICEHLGSFNSNTKLLHCYVFSNKTTNGVEYKVINTKLK